jgi:hypothetical protein
MTPPNGRSRREGAWSSNRGRTALRKVPSRRQPATS